MAKFGYIENDKVKFTVDALPLNWDRYSNFNAFENDIEFLNSVGWYQVEMGVQEEYDPFTQGLGEFQYSLDGNVLKQTQKVVNLVSYDADQQTVVRGGSGGALTEEQIQAHIQAENERIVAEKWTEVRNLRDRIMADNDWRYDRYNREVRLELTPTESIEDIDTFMQALANITNQDDPFSIVWPDGCGPVTIPSPV